MVTIAPVGNPQAGEGRVVFAFFVQPLVVGLLAFALFPVIDFTGRALHGGRPINPLGAAISVGLGAALASVVVLVFAALPAYVWLQKRRAVTLRRTLLAGAVLGNVPGALILVLLVVGRLIGGTASGSGYPISNSLTYGFLGIARAILLGALIGTAASAVFWLMTSPHREITD